MASEGGETAATGGRSRGGGGKGRGGGRGRERQASGGGGSQDIHEPGGSGGTRFSALGNPLPPIIKNDVPPTAVPRTSNPSTGQRSAQSTTAPPNVNRSSSQTSTPSVNSERGGGGRRPGGNRGERKSNSGDNHMSGSSGNGGAPMPRTSSASAMPRWSDSSSSTPRESGDVRRESGDVRQPFQQQRPVAAAPTVSAMPEMLNTSAWGDAEEEEVSQEVVESRLRMQLERARSEKVAIQKLLNESHAAVDQAKAEATKFKSEVDQLKQQIEKAALMEKSYNTLRQTRDLIETERDTLKKSLSAIEKESKLQKDEAEKRITKLQIDVEALQAQVDYQRLELEEARVGAGPSTDAILGKTPNMSATWLYASERIRSTTALADKLSFSHLEVSQLNASLWDKGAIGFVQSLASVVFERAGEKLSVESPNALKESEEAFSRILQTAETLLIVPSRPANVSPQLYEQCLLQFIALMANARDASRTTRNFAVIIEDFPQNRVALGTKVIPVVFLI